MKELVLKRISSTMFGTFGVLFDSNIPFVVTLEQCWNDNEKYKSCIPKGDYICEKYISSKYGSTFIINGVPERDGILFHWGNLIKDTQGCILIGNKFGRLKNFPCILESKIGFNNFMKKVENEGQFKLTIAYY